MGRALSNVGSNWLNDDIEAMDVGCGATVESFFLLALNASSAVGSELYFMFRTSCITAINAVTNTDSAGAGAVPRARRRRRASRS